MLSSLNPYVSEGSGDAERDVPTQGSCTSPGASRSNTFDALRLLAAVAVLVSHSFVLAGRPQPTLGDQDLGTFGVWVFFSISGFLITRSWLLDPRPAAYFAKRALRILPGLFLVVLLTALVVGPLVTTLPPAQYLRDPQSWSYIWHNLTLQRADVLPGVFADNPYPRQVNGSLWTLGPEVWCYAAVAVVGLAGGLRRAWVPPLTAVALLVWPHVPAVPWPDAVFLLQAFAVGASLYVLRDRIPWHWGPALAGAAAVAFTSGSVQLHLAVIVVPYITVLLAYRGPQGLRRLTAHGDVSYGLYLFAWPVGQVIVWAWGTSVTPALLIAVALPLTYVLALLSWRLVERPALALKRLTVRSSEPRVPEAAWPGDVVVGGPSEGAGGRAERPSPRTEHVVARDDSAADAPPQQARPVGR